MPLNIGEPYYSEPPLVEVSISAQFEPIVEIHLGYLGLIWEIYKDKFPQVQHIDELPHSIEKFGVIKREIPKFKFQENMPYPRVRFTSSDNKSVIQVQRDRFIYNWRRDESPASEYPRYDSIRSSFLEEFGKFVQFLQNHDLPSLNFNQAELTYVNHIDAGQHAIQDVFRDYIIDPNYSDNLELEHFSTKFQHLITEEGQKIGRLYTSMDKGNLILDNSSIYRLNFTARSHPLDQSLEGMIKVMDKMRSTINSSFTAITTTNMHEDWNKE